MMRIQQKSAMLNGVELAYLDAGAGPDVVVLLHGFPDDAFTWSKQIPALTGAGYRVVAPFLRGFPPSQVPQDGTVNLRVQGEDAAALIREVSNGPVHLVGHDWGALATQVVLATAPELVNRAVVVAASHPATLLAILEMPEVVSHLFHVWFFQLEGLAEDALRANDLALVDYLWDRWTARGHYESEHIKRLKEEKLSRPGVIEALLPWYRALVRMPLDDPEFTVRMLEPNDRATLSIWGAEDPANAAAHGEEGFFLGEYRREVLDGASHFVHRERPTEFNELLLGWLGRPAYLEAG